MTRTHLHRKPPPPGWLPLSTLFRGTTFKGLSMRSTHARLSTVLLLPIAALATTLAACQSTSSSGAHSEQDPIENVGSSSPPVREGVAELD